MDRELIPSIEILPPSLQRPASASASINRELIPSTEIPPPSQSIQPQMQALKLLLQKKQWPQLQPEEEEEGEEADALTKAENEHTRLFEQYSTFKYTADDYDLARSDKVKSRLAVYFRRYHSLLIFTDSQSADAIVKEVRNSISTHIDRHALLRNALEESKEQLAAKRKEFYDKLLAQVVGFGKKMGSNSSEK